MWNSLRRRPTEPQRPLRRRRAECRKPRIETACHRHEIVQPNFAPRKRGRDLPFQIAEHLAALSRGVSDAHDALRALDVGYPNHFAFVRFPEGAICTRAL
jgi:hypothetical protein